MQQEKKLKPLPEQALKCPRCDSTNTKFCYYNNYSLSQPRYFCKGCRRYWTQGGSLRNVPVGGGCRKNKRSSSTCANAKRTQDQSFPTSTSPMFPSLQNQGLPYDPSDLTLAFARMQKPPTRAEHCDSFFTGNANHDLIGQSTTGFLDILRSGGVFDSHGTTGGFHNLYPVFGGPGGNVDEKAAPALAFGEANGAPATIRPESCKNPDGDCKTVTGMQYFQVGGDGNVSLDNGKDYWGSVGPVGGSAWHGLVNSSLM